MHWLVLIQVKVFLSIAFLVFWQFGDIGQKTRKNYILQTFAWTLKPCLTEFIQNFDIPLFFTELTEK
jgi:hypothetical protein